MLFLLLKICMHKSGWIIPGKFEQRGLKYWPFPSDRYIAVFTEDTRGNEIRFTSPADPAGLIKLITTNHGKFTFYKWSYSNFITTDFYPSAAASTTGFVDRGWLLDKCFFRLINLTHRTKHAISQLVERIKKLFLKLTLLSWNLKKIFFFDRLLS